MWQFMAANKEQHGLVDQKGEAVASFPDTIVFHFLRNKIIRHSILAKKNRSVTMDPHLTIKTKHSELHSVS